MEKRRHSNRWSATSSDSRSPRDLASHDGRGAPNPRPHADDIDPGDFPVDWLGRDITVDVEAKAKEAAVVRVRAALESRMTNSRATAKRASRRRLAR